MEGTISTKSSSILDLFIYLFIVSCWVNITEAQPRITSTGRTVEGTTDYSMSCTIITVDPLRSITWERLGEVDVAIDAVEQQRSVAGLIETKATITLAITRADDEQQFRCTTVQSNNVVQTAIERLFVDVIPTPPVIQGPESISENKTGVYTCTSSGGRPASSIRWRWSNGQGLYNDNVSTVINADNTFNTISDLPLLGIAGYNGRILICEVSHYHLNEKQTATVPISVVYKPGVTIDKVYYTQTIGNTLTIQCTVVSSPPATSVNWLYNDTSLVRTSRHRNGDVTNPSLTINNVNLDDSGIYTCTASNNVGTFNSNPTRVEITSPPIVTIPGNTIIRGDLGQEVTLPCTVVSNPAATRVIWRKGTESLVALNGSKYTGSTPETPSLTILNLSREDNSKYQCTAENNFGTGLSSQIVDLIINYAPTTISVTPPTQNIDENQPLSVTCSTDGEPSPSYTWTRNGETVGSGSRYFIQRAGPSDWATYTCTGSNSKGSLSGNATVTVFFTPKVDIPQSAHGADEGSSVVIGCNFSSNPQSTRVQWSHDNVVIDIAASGGKYSGGTLATPSLTITDLRSTDGGVYTCTVTNSRGSGQDVTQVSISYAPQPGSVTTLNANPPEGDNITLTCAINGVPEPTYVWLKNGVQISVGKTLRLTSVAEADTGSYICTATNDKGSINATSDISVTYPPKVKFADGVTEVRGNDTAVIPLEVNASPGATSIQWYKNGEPLVLDPAKHTGGTPGSPTLTINNLTPNDNGVYQVEVTNNRGTIRSPTITVIGNFAPSNVVVEPVTITTREGDVVIVRCTANGSPAPTFSWNLNNGKYSDGAILNVTAGPDIHQAVFQCVASNSRGSSTAISNINVEFTPQLTFDRNTITVNNDDEAIIPLNIKSNPAPTSIRWYKDGQPLALTAPKYTGGTLDNPTLTISGVVMADLGRYQAEVTNSIGTQRSPTINVTGVFAPSQVSVSTPYINVTLGSPIAVDCTSNGEPRPTFTWYRDGVRYSQGTRLAISSTTVDDLADFKCEAVNQVGKASASTRVNVLFRPVATDDPDQYQYYGDVGDRINITCAVRSNPPPTGYRWWFNNKELVGETSSYLNVLINNTLYGDYVCRAFNVYGESQDIRITLQDNAEPRTEESTGLSMTYIILIVLIVIIIIVIIIILIIFCCTQGLCLAIFGKKRAASKSQVTPAPIVPGEEFPTGKPGKTTAVAAVAATGNGYTSSDSTVTRKDVNVDIYPASGHLSRPKTAKLRIDDDGSQDHWRGGKGPIISIMEGETHTPRAHQLPPLGYEPTTETPVKKMKRKKKRRPKPEINESESAALTSNQPNDRGSPSSDV